MKSLFLFTEHTWGSDKVRLKQDDAALAELVRMISYVSLKSIIFGRKVNKRVL